MPISNSYLKLIIFFTGIFAVTNMYAQENPPIPVAVEVRNAQFLNFGSFTVGPLGGTVSVDFNGTRNSTGDIHLLNIGSSSVSYAIFDVYANPGTILQIQYPTEVKLVGPPASDVRLTIDPDREIETGRIFVTTMNPHEVNVGGTLNILTGDAAPPGPYNGSFSLTFIHQ
ncbi:MAG TPA: DUF4402 domain-containing protein [Gillisia sp.]|nr:DUF4402 domain-containing protein [Gillisia sp.]